jgi:RNA-directed DNA polymerase
MHDPVAQTGEWLKSVVQGYFNYHALPWNMDSLGIFRERVIRLWRRTLIRRSQTHCITWDRMYTLAERWLPRPRELHLYLANCYGEPIFTGNRAGEPAKVD